jgi:hypothetical protein
VANATFTPDTVTIANLTPAQLEVTPTGKVPLRPEHRFTLRRSTPGPRLNWHAYDPDTVVICKYGSFRYACEIGTGMNPGELLQELVVKVPHLGRGQTVGIILKNPYGESAPFNVTIDPVVTSTISHKSSILRPAAGKIPLKASPAASGMGLLENGRTKPCDLPYMVWKDLTTDGKMYAAGALGGIADLKLAGDASVRVVSVPRGQPITDNVDVSWASTELDIPAGLAQAWTYSLTYSYETRPGECPAKRC